MPQRAKLVRCAGLRAPLYPPLHTPGTLPTAKPCGGLGAHLWGAGRAATYMHIPPHATHVHTGTHTCPLFGTALALTQGGSHKLWGLLVVQRVGASRRGNGRGVRPLVYHLALPRSLPPTLTFALPSSPAPQVHLGALPPRLHVSSGEASVPPAEATAPALPSNLPVYGGSRTSRGPHSFLTHPVALRWPQGSEEETETPPPKRKCSPVSP